MKNLLKCFSCSKILLMMKLMTKVKLKNYVPFFFVCLTVRKFNLNLFFGLMLLSHGIKWKEEMQKERVRAKRFVNVFSFIATVVPVIVGVCVWVCVCFSSTLVSPGGLGTLNLPQLSVRGFRSFCLMLPHVTSFDCSMKSIDCRNVLIVVVVVALVVLPRQKVKSFNS